MKKLFLILFFLFLNMASYGQSLDGYGFKIGLSITNQNWDYKDLNQDLEWENSSGILAKVFGEASLLPFLNAVSEVGYAQKGVKDKIEITTPSEPWGTGEFMNINNRLNYLSVSLMGKLKYSLSLFAPYIVFGPEYNYLMSKEVEAGFGGVYDKFKKNGLGYTIGVGSEVKLLPIHILVEYRYARDLANNYELTNIEIKNYSHSFLIGIKM